MESDAEQIKSEARNAALLEAATMLRNVFDTWNNRGESPSANALLVCAGELESWIKVGNGKPPVGEIKQAEINGRIAGIEDASGIVLEYRDKAVSDAEYEAALRLRNAAVAIRAIKSGATP